MLTVKNRAKRIYAVTTLAIITLCAVLGYRMWSSSPYQRSASRNVLQDDKKSPSSQPFSESEENNNRLSLFEELRVLKTRTIHENHIYNLIMPDWPGGHTEFMLDKEGKPVLTWVGMIDTTQVIIFWYPVQKKPQVVIVFGRKGVKRITLGRSKRYLPFNITADGITAKGFMDYVTGWVKNERIDSLTVSAWVNGKKFNVMQTLWLTKEGFCRKWSVIDLRPQDVQRQMSSRPAKTNGSDNSEHP